GSACTGTGAFGSAEREGFMPDQATPHFIRPLLSQASTPGEAERYRTLLEINNAIISNLTPEPLFRAVAQALRRVFPIGRSAIFLHNPEKDALRLFMLESSLPSRYFHIGLEMPAGESHVGWVFQQQRPLLRRNLEMERQYPMEDRAYEDGVRSYIIVPLVARGQAIGTLAVASTTPNQYSESDAAFLQEAANQVALAVENMQAYERMEQEATLRRQSEEMLRSITEGTAAVTGVDFFPSLVRHMAAALRVRFAFVTESVDPANTRVRSLAFWKGDGFGDGFEFEVAGTPCEEVLKGKVASYPRDVQRLFPRDRDLVDLGAVSYLGIPIFGASGHVIGHLAILHDKPMEQDERREATLKIFAARAGAELQRQRAEQALREMHQFSQEVINGASEGIIVYDADLRYLVFNRFMEKLTGRRAEEVVGKYAPDVFPFLRENGMEDLLRRALQGDVVTTPDLLIRMPSGREVWESNTYGPHRDSQGSIIGVIALVSDITQRKQAEEALRQALAEVEQLKNRLQAENVYLQEEIRREHDFVEMVGNSPALLAVLRKVEQVAPTDSTVLICGETGTGKELIARAIHSRSRRKDRPLVKVDCSAISAGLVESELFGHVKGAFTGAIERRTGRFELADGGTIFLDEVGELPAETQAKLLRVLQEQQFEPVGSNRTVRVDVRVIAATNRDLEEAVRTSRFRSDLYYRLNVFPLETPSLRERRSDIPQLVMFYLSRFAKRYGKKAESVTRETMDRLVNYPWPGNVRELQNLIERAVVLSEGSVLELDRDLRPAPAGAMAAGEAVGGPRQTVASVVPEPSKFLTLEETERNHILAALQETGGVIEGPKGAAKILDLHPNTLRSRMEKLGIKRSRHGIS
ncbi:MAG TPA: sigma 54-interacting transcriptional regulator, partial [Candidatus Methylomirabilis sp.]|nr:sigma 54-interacting transcriptional regulator [Candidatus Methylomirabilis sp.]